MLLLLERTEGGGAGTVIPAICRMGEGLAAEVMAPSFLYEGGGAGTLMPAISSPTMALLPASDKERRRGMGSKSREDWRVCLVRVLLREEEGLKRLPELNSNERLLVALAGGDLRDAALVLVERERERERARKGGKEGEERREEKQRENRGLKEESGGTKEGGIEEDREGDINKRRGRG